MSSDTAKRIALAVDSSMSDCKKDMVNLEDSVPSMGTGTCRSGAEEVGLSCYRVGSASETKKDKLNNTRYFIIKSLNHQNIQLSIKKGIWATQVTNEPILEEAFQNNGKVILIFSVNMSGFFQGYAKMMSSVGWGRDNIWSQGSEKNNPWGHSFRVKWLRLNDLPFRKTLHLKNPWNDFKPVKISRDCQELPGDIGQALCQLLDEAYDTDVTRRRDEVSDGDFATRRTYIDQFHSVQDEDFNGPPMHMAPLLYPSLLYQYQDEVTGFQLLHQTPGIILNNGSSVPDASKVKQSRSFQVNGSSTNGADTQISSWALPAERSTFFGTFTEDDILEMTYEEYLEAHTRRSRRLLQSAAGRSVSLQKSSSSKERSDDLQSASSSTKKRTHSQFLE